MTAESHLDDLAQALRDEASAWRIASDNVTAARNIRLLTAGADAIVALHARAVELEKDAARYRWLRHDYVSPRRSKFAVVINNAHPSGLKRYWDISLDDALDAEMREQKDKGG